MDGKDRNLTRLPWRYNPPGQAVLILPPYHWLVVKNGVVYMGGMN